MAGAFGPKFSEQTDENKKKLAGPEYKKLMNALTQARQKAGEAHDEWVESKAKLNSRLPQDRIIKLQNKIADSKKRRDAAQKEIAKANAALDKWYAANKMI